MALKNNIIKIVTLVFALTLFPTLAMAADYIIDVRTLQEYATDHIPGHLNIVHSQIVEGVKALNITPEDHIYLYCRSGRRASIALEELNKSGYKNVTNVGGLEDAKKFFK